MRQFNPCQEVRSNCKISHLFNVSIDRVQRKCNKVEAIIIYAWVDRVTTHNIELIASKTANIFTLTVSICLLLCIVMIIWRMEKADVMCKYLYIYIKTLFEFDSAVSFLIQTSYRGPILPDVGFSTTMPNMMTSWHGTLSAWLALCEGNPPVTGGFPSQRPSTAGLDVFFEVNLNKRLCKQSRWR